MCRGQESLVQAFSCEFWGNFKNIYFVEHLCEPILAWNEAIKKRLHVNIFTEKHRWGCRLKYSRYEGLEFYLKGTQSQILSCKMCEVLQSFSFTEHYLLLGNYFWLPATFLPCFFPLLYQQYINSVTTSCLGTPEIATCKRYILLALKIFKGNQKKTKSIVTLLDWGRLSKQKDV